VEIGTKLLSRGRSTILIGTLWDLPIYFMSSFTIPTSIAWCLEKIMRAFLWSNNDSTNGLDWINLGGILSSQAKERARN